MSSMYLKSIFFYVVFFVSNFSLAESIPCFVYNQQKDFNFKAVGAKLEDGRLPFWERVKDCKIEEKNCVKKMKQYLVVGDKVLVNKLDNEWACVTYASKPEKAVSGWVQVKFLVDTVSAQQPALKSLQGKWRSVLNPRTSNFSANIVITNEGKHWKGLVMYKNNTGDFEGDITSHAEQFQLKQAECQVFAVYNEPYLFVGDNKKCGGLNVSFDSLYLRSEK